jgi:ketosteroid isomerase-like protein
MASMTDADIAGTQIDTERLERNKRIAWEHFRALAEGRLEDCLALVDGSGVFWRNAAFGGRRPSVSLQVWKDEVTAMIERRVPIPWQAEHVHLITLLAEGDQVVLEIHNDSLPYHDGRRNESYDMVYLFVVEIRDGIIVGIREYPDGFLMASMLADGTAPEQGVAWWDLKARENAPRYRLPDGVCESCGRTHANRVPAISGPSPGQLRAQRNKQIAWEHFRAVDEGRLDDALALLHTDGAFWGGARIGDRPRSASSIESWRREMTDIVKQILPMPWTGSAHLINTVAEGDQVMLEIHNTAPLHAHFPPQGEYDMIYAWVLTMRDGKILDIREYPDGIYGVSILAQFFPGAEGTVSPTSMLGELPFYEPPRGSCVSCGKIHRSQVEPFLAEG